MHDIGLEWWARSLTDDDLAHRVRLLAAKETGTAQALLQVASERLEMRGWDPTPEPVNPAGKSTTIPVDADEPNIEAGLFDDENLK